MMTEAVRKAIQTYSTEAFRERYMKRDQKLNSLLKPDFGRFFITPVEEMIRLIRLPVPPARSTTHTFIYLAGGEAVMTIGHKTYTIYKDQCLFVPAGQVFSFATVDENKGFLCNFHPDFVISAVTKSMSLASFEFLKVWGNPCIKLDEQASADVHQLLERMFRSYSAQGLEQLHILQSYLTALLLEINSVFKPLSPSSTFQPVSLTNQFKELLFKHIKAKHLVKDYAALLHVTPSHLNRTVKLVTGKSPTKWIDEALLLEAKVLLYQTSFSIAEVADEIGMSDSSYFTRLFKKYQGVTPRQYRKMIEKS